MSIIFMDGFDHYGTDEGNMLDGVYLAVTGLFLSTEQVRTGTYSMKYNEGANNNTRRGLGGEFATIGAGYGIYLDEMPGGNNTLVLGAFHAEDNSPHVALVASTTGNIIVYRGFPASGNIIHATVDQPLVASAWHYLEWKLYIHDSAGYIEVRLNGVTVINETGLDTLYDASGVATNFKLPGAYSFNATTDMYTDDLIVWSTAGTENNDFLGDRRVRTILPDADTADADWTPVGASNGNDCINEVDPDDDTTYIEVDDSALPSYSQFGLPNTPAGTAAIAGIEVYLRGRKTEAGTATFMASLVQGSDAVDGPEKPLTSEWTYWSDVFELDPATGALWTPSGIDSAELGITRVQ